MSAHEHVDGVEFIDLELDRSMEVTVLWSELEFRVRMSACESKLMMRSSPNSYEPIQMNSSEAELIRVNQLIE
jgi:hypothetical protein